MHPCGTETILVADDDDTLRRVTVLVLSTHGYRVLEARGGDAALLIAEANPDTLVTSGADGVFPAGLVVGRVRNLSRTDHGVFQVARTLWRYFGKMPSQVGPKRPAQS